MRGHYSVMSDPAVSDDVQVWCYEVLLVCSVCSKIPTGVYCRDWTTRKSVTLVRARV